MASEQDWADLHVARWRDHWVGVSFDDDTEALFIRMGRLLRHLKHAYKEAYDAVGLQEFEYDTLHHLMIRDTPGHATPSDLADQLGISGAGMTGRLDALEQQGWIQRRPSPDDRRRVYVEVTGAGVDVWRRAIALRGQAIDDLAAHLTERERRTVARLLKKMTLATPEH